MSLTSKIVHWEGCRAALTKAQRELQEAWDCFDRGERVRLLEEAIDDAFSLDDLEAAAADCRSEGGKPLPPSKVLSLKAKLGVAVKDDEWANAFANTYAAHWVGPFGRYGDD